MLCCMCLRPYVYSPPAEPKRDLERIVILVDLNVCPALRTESHIVGEEFFVVQHRPSKEQNFIYAVCMSRARGDVPVIDRYHCVFRNDISVVDVIFYRIPEHCDMPLV